MKTPYRYQTIHDALLERIRSGDLRPGDRLPSQRQLMALHGASYSTVTAALNALHRAGLIVSQHGKGTFVSQTQCEENKPEPQRSAQGVQLAVFMSNFMANPTGVFKGAYDASHALGIRLEFVIYHGEKERRQRCKEMLDGKIPVDGALLINLPGYNDVVEACQKARFPYVIMDAPCPFAGMHQVLLDHGKAAAQAVSHLIDHGHEHIGLIIGPLTNEDEEEDWAASKMRGYKQALEAGGLPYDERLVRIMPSYASEHVEAALSDLLAQQDLTALFVANGNNALQVLDGLRSRGKRVPRDVAVVSFNVNAREEMASPEYTLSGVDVPRAPAGEAAVRLLLRLINDRTLTDAQCMELPLPFIRRRSCGCA